MVQRQDFFLSTAEHGEQSVSGGLCGRLSPVEIVFIFFTQGHVLFHNLGFDRRLLVEEAAQFGPGGLVLADVFGNDISCSGQGIFVAGDTFFRVDKEVERQRFDAFDKQLRQGFKPPFSGHKAPGFAFRAKRQVDVFELGEALRLVQLLLQGCRQAVRSW